MAFVHFHNAQYFRTVRPKVLAAAEHRRLLRLELDQSLFGIIGNATAAFGQVIDRHILGGLVNMRFVVVVVSIEQPNTKQMSSKKKSNNEQNRRPTNNKSTQEEKRFASYTYTYLVQTR